MKTFFTWILAISVAFTPGVGLAQDGMPAGSEPTGDEIPFNGEGTNSADMFPDEFGPAEEVAEEPVEIAVGEEEETVEEVIEIAEAEEPAGEDPATEQRNEEVAEIVEKITLQYVKDELQDLLEQYAEDTDYDWHSETAFNLLVGTTDSDNDGTPDWTNYWQNRHEDWEIETSGVSTYDTDDLTGLKMYWFIAKKRNLSPEDAGDPDPEPEAPADDAAEPADETTDDTQQVVSADDCEMYPEDPACMDV